MLLYAVAIIVAGVYAIRETEKFLDPGTQPITPTTKWAMILKPLLGWLGVVALVILMVVYYF